MSTFWKPITTARVMDLPATPCKKLGQGVYALWCRCDLCTWSGPFESFNLLEHPEHAHASTICDGCRKSEDLMLQLERDGWVMRG